MIDAEIYARRHSVRPPAYLSAQGRARTVCLHMNRACDAHDIKTQSRQSPKKKVEPRLEPSSCIPIELRELCKVSVQKYSAFTMLLFLGISNLWLLVFMNLDSAGEFPLSFWELTSPKQQIHKLSILTKSKVVRNDILCLPYMKPNSSRGKSVPFTPCNCM